MSNLQYFGTWNYLGVPDDIVPADEEITEQYISSIRSALPERQPVPDYNPQYLTGNTDLIMQQDGVITITFLHEGAGYKNSVGYFIYDEGSPPQTPAEVNHIVLFPNTSLPGSGGGLYAGATLDLGTIPAGKGVGFFLKSNAWKGSKTEIWRGYNTFYSLDHLNPEWGASKKRHVALISYQADQEGNQKLVMGFEDIFRYNRGCDHDFNDAIFYIKSTPPEAVDWEHFAPANTTQDTDGDAVNDEDDRFPNDPTRAYTYESIDNNLCFEDKFPFRGDNDINDLVLKANYTRTLNASLELVEFSNTYHVAGMGALFQNGFYLQLDNVPPSNIKSVQLTMNNAILEGDVIEEGHTTDTVFKIFENAHNHIGDVNLDDAIYRQGEIDGDTFVISVEFNTPVTGLEAPYNPFITVNQVRSHEVHLINKKPSSLFDTSIFNTHADKSDPDNDEYFHDKDNAPWAMEIPAGWQIVKEKENIYNAYPLFRNWCVNRGVNYSDWTSIKNVNLLY